MKASQFTGGPDQKEDPEWIVVAIRNGSVIVYDNLTFGKCNLDIETLEGVMTAEVGDYVIQGVKGEIYPCKPDIFKLSYEKI